MRMATLWRAALALSLFTPALFAQDLPAGDEEADPAVILPDAAEARQIVAMLEAGFAEGKTALREAQRRLDAIRRNPKHDPRADYAYGLVLLKNFKPQEAGESFAAAVDARHLIYLPAWMAHIRARLLQRDYYEGLELLDELAALLADPATRLSDPQASLQGAYWVGRVISACQIAKVKVNDGPDPTRMDASFLRLFERDLNDAYQRGRESVDQEFEKLSSEFDRAALHVERMQKDRQKRRQSKIEEKRRQVKDETQTVERTTLEWEAWLEEELERIDQALESLKKEYETLAETDVEIADAMLRLSRERVAARYAERAGFRTRRRNDFVPLSLRIEQKLVEYQKQRNKLSAEANAVNEQARTLVSQREETTRKYKAATGQLVKNESETQKWKQAFEKATQKNKANSSKAARSVRARKNRLKKISTYLEFDADQAKAALLDELRPSP